MVVVEGNWKCVAREIDAVQEVKVTRGLGSARGHVASLVPIDGQLLGYGVGAVSAPTRHHQDPIHTGLCPVRGGAPRIGGSGKR
jgi:hypothetical protein